MTIPARLPWHAAQWQSFAAALDAGRVHHALLLQGPPGLGKLRFAERAAAALLCESQAPAAERPCGECRSCALVAAGSHPDRLQLAPEEDRTQIDVAQVRQRIADLALTAHYASRRVILVAPADALNRHAANTLLKTLEEPPGGAVFLLVSASPASLPATVRSRCAAVRFLAPDADSARRWLAGEEHGDAAASILEWCGGAPLSALDAARDGEAQHYDEMIADLDALAGGTLDPIAAAARWRTVGLRRTLQWQLRVLARAMRSCAAGERAPAAGAMQSLGARLDLRAMDALCEELLELRSALERRLNPAEQLALESLAVSWRDAARPPG